MGIEDEEDIADMKKIREQRELEQLQEREEQKNETITLAQRTTDKAGQVRQKKDAEIVMNHLKAD